MMSKPDSQRIEIQKLHVLIVSTRGAHQKAIQALCAAIPEINVIETAFSTLQAFEVVRDNPPDLVILGANLSESSVCEFLSQIERLSSKPYCIALTVSEYGNCIDQAIKTEQIVASATFAQRLPEILDQIHAQ